MHPTQEEVRRGRTLPGWSAHRTLRPIVIPAEFAAGRSPLWRPERGKQG